MPIDPEYALMEKIIIEISALMYKGDETGDYSEADTYIHAFDYKNKTVGEIIAVLRTPSMGSQHLPNYFKSLEIAKQSLIVRGEYDPQLLEGLFHPL